MSTDALDLYILDSGGDEFAILLARSGDDLAVGRLPFGQELADLSSFRDRIDRAVRGFDDRPKPAELEAYGRRLFSYTFRDKIRRLYDLLPQTDVRINVLSDRAEVQKLPWEYLQEPDFVPGPRRQRSVVRIVPTIGQKPPPLIRLQETIRVLFVSAAPIDQGPVDFAVVRAAIERTFGAKIPGRFTLKAVDGATRESFGTAVKEPFDILHFSGHGDVSADGKGRLLLVHRKNGSTDYLDARSLSKLLRGRDIRLVVLSACETSQGDFRDDFAVIAETLVNEGIPAVVANQMPVSNKSIAPFVGALYETLLTCGDIDLAVSDGRIALDLELGSAEFAAIEWGIPTLYRNYAASKLYQP
jgi:hypothetical protein